MGYSLRDNYGILSDNHVGNVRNILGKEFLDLSKNKDISIGKDSKYDYKSSKYYKKLEVWTRTKSSFGTKNYTNANKYN